jgi:hypothetical protein
MQNVLLDTNAILMPFQFKLNLDIELYRLVGAHKIYVPASVIAELELLCQKKIKFSKSATKLAKRYEIIGNTEESCDSAILKLAKELDAYVVTNDTVLQKKLHSEGITVIFLRSRKKLVFYNKQKF